MPGSRRATQRLPGDRHKEIPNPAKRVAKPGGTPRLTQAERAAISREKVIGAAVDCLASVGYAATTTNLIAATAGVSIGRLQHHFATKVDVMAAVIEHIQDANSLLLSLASLDQSSARGRVEQYAGRLLAAFQQDTAAAAIEIRFAMKGDEDLAATLSSKFEEYDARAFSELENLLVAADVTPTSARTWSRTMVAAVRGLAVERVGFYRVTKQPNADESLKLLVLAIFGASEG